jgi:hypothetical protein
MKEVAFVLCIFAGFIAVCAAAKNGMESYACSKMSEITGKPTKYTWQNGCFVKVKDGWIPSSKWRVID